MEVYQTYPILINCSHVCGGWGTRVEKLVRSFLITSPRNKINMENCNVCDKEITQEEFDNGLGECLMCFPEYI